MSDLLVKLFTGCLGSCAEPAAASDDDQVAIKTNVLCCVHANRLDIADNENENTEAAATAPLQQQQEEAG